MGVGGMGGGGWGAGGSKDPYISLCGCSLSLAFPGMSPTTLNAGFDMWVEFGLSHTASVTRLKLQADSALFRFVSFFFFFWGGEGGTWRVNSRRNMKQV